MPQRGRAVHVAAENGKLIGVTAVARVHPRNWDGRRLLRFLAGLAMLALAFTTPAPAAPAPPPVVTVSDSVEATPVTQGDVRVMAAPIAAEELSSPAVTAVTIGPAGTLLAGALLLAVAALLSGLILPAAAAAAPHAGRAPPPA
jgi:hypothetical protein